MLGDDHSHVVGAADGRGAHGVVQADGLTGRQTELGRRLRGRAGRDGQDVVQLDLARFQRLERQVQGHDLGDGGGIAPGVGEAREQDFARGGVHHDGGVPAVGRLGFRRRDADRRRQDHAAQNQGGQETAAEEDVHGQATSLVTVARRRLRSRTLQKLASAPAVSRGLRGRQRSFDRAGLIAPTAEGYR